MYGACARIRAGSWIETRRVKWPRQESAAAERVLLVDAMAMRQASKSELMASDCVGQHASRRIGVAAMVGTWTAWCLTWALIEVNSAILRSTSGECQRTAGRSAQQHVPLPLTRSRRSRACDSITDISAAGTAKWLVWTGER